MLHLKYVMFTDERKPITVATKNVTLSAKLFFPTTGSSQKNASEPLQLLGSMPITSAHPMLHWCNIFNENFPETGELNASEALIVTSTFKNTDTKS